MGCKTTIDNFSHQKAYLKDCPQLHFKNFEGEKKIKKLAEYVTSYRKNLKKRRQHNTTSKYLNLSPVSSFLYEKDLNLLNKTKFLTDDVIKKRSAQM